MVPELQRCLCPLFHRLLMAFLVHLWFLKDIPDVTNDSFIDVKDWVKRFIFLFNSWISWSLLPVDGGIIVLGHSGSSQAVFINVSSSVQKSKVPLVQSLVSNCWPGPQFSLSPSATHGPVGIHSSPKTFSLTEMIDKFQLKI